MTPLQRTWIHSHALNDPLGDDVRAFVKSEFERCKNEVLDKVEVWVSESDGSDSCPPLDLLHECAREMSEPRSAHSRECFTFANDSRLSGLSSLLTGAEYMPAELASRVLDFAKEQLAVAVSAVRTQLSAAVDRSTTQTREWNREERGSESCISIVTLLRSAVKQLEAFLAAGNPQRAMSLEWPPVQASVAKTSDGKRLYRFFAKVGREGVVDSVFIATPEQVQETFGERVDFGPVLGEHSDVSIDVKAEHFSVLSKDPAIITALGGKDVSTISGCNPLQYLWWGHEEVNESHARCYPGSSL